MSVFSAFFGGFHNFFSIWIFCLMQIVPFLLAFMIGASINDDETSVASGEGRWTDIVLSIASPLAGFSAIFVSIGMVTTSISKAIFRSMDILNVFGGVFIGLAGFYLAGLLTVRIACGTRMRVVKLVSGTLFGAALGIAYKPCVTPTLTKVYNINTMPENAFSGAVLLVGYALGISCAVALTGALLVRSLSRVVSPSARSWIKRGCGYVILIVSFLIITDKMTYYKSFLVEGFVPSNAEMEGGHEHEGHSHGGGSPGSVGEK